MFFQRNDRRLSLLVHSFLWVFSHVFKTNQTSLSEFLLIGLFASFYRVSLFNFQGPFAFSRKRLSTESTLFEELDYYTITLRFCQVLFLWTLCVTRVSTQSRSQRAWILYHNIRLLSRPFFLFFLCNTSPFSSVFVDIIIFLSVFSMKKFGKNTHNTFS